MPRPGRKAPRGKGCRAKGAHDFAGDEVTLAGEGHCQRDCTASGGRSRWL